VLGTWDEHRGRHGWGRGYPERGGAGGAGGAGVKGGHEAPMPQWRSKGAMKFHILPGGVLRQGSGKRLPWAVAANLFAVLSLEHAGSG